MAKKVLFLDTVHSILQERLEELGYVCEDGTQMNLDLFKKNISDYYGLVIRSRITLDAELLERANQLRFIARSGAGMENIDIQYAKQKGIHCFNSPEGNRIAVGEHTTGMLLALLNKIIVANNEVKGGVWNREKNRGLEIAGKTIGIIGYGNMGSAFARCLKGFDCRVIAYDKFKNNFSSDYVEEVDLETLFSDADIVSLHTPLTKDTENMVNRKFIHQFQKNIIIINTARGNIVNTDDLVTEMKSGKVLGACLDVLEYEKASFENIMDAKTSATFDYLTQSNEIILSPHVAGWTVESYFKLSSFLADKIESTFHSSST